MAACKHFIIIVVFYLYFLTSYQAKLNYLTKQQCSKYLVPITNSTFGNEEGRKFVFGHFQLYSLLSPTMIQQTNKSRCAKNKQYQRILKSKSCKYQLRSFLHLLVLIRTGVFIRFESIRIDSHRRSIKSIQSVRIDSEVLR